MKISVIMCAYNTEEFIDRAINSILSQTFQDWELIICDDGSKDNTIAIAKKYIDDPRVKVHARQQNVGYIRNKNQAFELATGQLLTQLDADDICPSQRLELQAKIFEQHPEIKICGTNFEVIDLQDKRLFGKLYEEDFFVTEPMQDYPFWFPGLMFRKELLDEFGAFSEYFSGIYGDDYHWTMRVNHKYPIYFIHDILYGYRVNPESLTNLYNGNDRKLIVPEIMAELLRQQSTHGTDWIEKGETGRMKEFEQQVLNNKSLMAEKYRIWAAKAIDYGYWENAKMLLNRSFKLDKTNLAYYRTWAYYIKMNRKNEARKNLTH